MSKKKSFILLIVILSLWSSNLFSQTSPAPTSRPSPTTRPASTDSSWRVTKEKSYPFYKVQILTKDNRAMPLGIEGTRAVIANQKGKTLAEVKGLVVEPDPRETIDGWTPGTLLDLDKDGQEDLVLRVYSGGAHCCYTYHIYSLGKILKKLADLKLNDCGEKIKLQDLDGDGRWEIVSCNAAFTYFKDIAYADSPFPPKVFGFENGKFVNEDKKFQKIFDDNIAAQRKAIQDRGYSDGEALQIILDYFLSDRETEGWAQFDQVLTSPKKESIRTELKDRWQKYLGPPPESKPGESGPAPLPSSPNKLP